ncbi:lactosylceramide alpha-2,3-sialyltransferase-like [Bos indicus]|uniref:beta-D-galactosyl-(1->3)-N-acetyl-beta-D-galactosaminide alpha-2,3-sialyltransferase n=1 Tax=Bos indicus TaxID=9915 RepID=A0ABM4TCA5_BOSIN
MRVPYLKLHLLATCVPTLWMMVFLLDQKSSQNDLRKMPGNHSKTCDCPQNSLRKCICSSEVHECSTCLGIPGESVRFDERFEMDVEPLMRAWSQRSLGIRISSHPKGLPHTHWTVWGAGLVQVGNSKFLLDSGLGLKIDQHDVVLRMNQAPVQGFEADVGKRTTVCITYPEIQTSGPWCPAAAASSEFIWSEVRHGHSAERQHHSEGRKSWISDSPGHPWK